MPAEDTPAIEVRSAQGLQIGDRNIQYNLFGSVVRSGYLEQVRRIAPAVLLDRERELAHMAEFCAEPPQHSGYMCWAGPAGVGKTALLAWFVLNPPPGVRVLSFFLTTRYFGHNDRVAFIDVMLEQLAELLGESMPAHLTNATREGHLLSMLKRAAHECQRQGQRLVLVVDGLDPGQGEREGSESYRIASLLPVQLESSMRIIVASNYWLAVDVPPGHPLRDPRCRHPLDQCAYHEERALAAARTADRRREAEERERQLRNERVEQANLRQARVRQDWDGKEAARLSLAARARAIGLALTFAAGCGLGAAALGWLTWGGFEPGVAVVLTLQATALGAGAAITLVPLAVRLGSVYRPALARPATWLPGARTALVAVPVTVVALVVSGMIAHDYLLARHERLVGFDPGFLPSFEELVAMVFVGVAIAGCGIAGRVIGVRTASPWLEEQRAREKAHRAAVADAGREATA